MPVPSPRRLFVTPRRRLSWLWGLVGGAACLGLCALLARMWAVNAQISAQASAKDAQLTALRAQLATHRKRLVALKGPRGREIVLHEHGYIRRGERILLFAPDK